MNFLRWSWWLPDRQHVELHSLELRNNLVLQKAAGTHEPALLRIDLTEDYHLEGILAFAAAVGLTATGGFDALSHALGQI